MSYRCPNGHDSATDDFCDVCGEPINPTSTPAAPSTPEPAASSLTLPEPPATPGATQRCPNCGDENAADALFCEKCGYDFTTGQLPAPPAPTASAAPAPPPAADWVAEIWIDPDWFAAQRAEGGCPTSGAPTVVALHGPSVLIGRHSKSHNIDPDIDCSGDGATSHRQAQLTLDHDRWHIEDLGSTNGTFVGTPGDPLPATPLPPHQRRELDEGERIYVGAWTRIAVRRATEDEKAPATG
jgi:hypothetical protein